MTSQRIFRAVAFAARHHGTQTYGGDPYLVHLMDVAECVEPRGDDDVVAAILHDVVEDTDVTIEMVREHFGARVAALVDGMTHRPGVPYADYIKGIPSRSRALKYADSLCNLRATIASSEGVRRDMRMARYQRNLVALSPDRGDYLLRVRPGDREIIDQAHYNFPYGWSEADRAS